MHNNIVGISFLFLSTCLAKRTGVKTGFVLAAQVTGKGPLGALGEHLSDPISKFP